MELTTLPAYLDTEDWLPEEVPAAHCFVETELAWRVINAGGAEEVSEVVDDAEMSSELLLAAENTVQSANDLTI